MYVREGGRWHLTMFFGPERREIRWKGEYREVVAPERLGFTVSDEPGEDSWEVVTVVLTDLGDGRTEMQLQQRAEMYKAAGDGWGRFFDRLAERPGRPLTPTNALAVSPRLATC